MNFQSQGKKIKYTLLDGLVHPTKYDKTSIGKATKEFIREGQEITLILLRNNDLVAKVIYSSLAKRNKNIKISIKKIQHNCHDKLLAILKK